MVIQEAKPDPPSQDEFYGGPRCVGSQAGPGGLLLDEGSGFLYAGKVIFLRNGVERGIRIGVG